MKKVKINLLLMSGNAHVGEDHIEYLGNSHSTLASEPSSYSLAPPVPFPPADIRTNANIIDGEFSCNYTFDGKASFFSVNLWTPTDNVIISINESPNFCSIKKFQNGQLTILNYAGSSSAVKTNEKARLTIRNNSGYISVFVNGILILTHVFPNNGVGLGFSAYGESTIKIENISVTDTIPKVFVVMQFKESFNELYKEVITPICHEFGLEVVRADESFNNGSIIHEILSELSSSRLVIADITPDNPNVYYEVGYAHAIKKDVILLCNEKREKLPFDLADFRTVFYKDSIAGHSQIKERLRKHIESIIKTNSPSPV